MKEKEGELRAAWLREEVENKGPGRWVEGFGLGVALRPPATPTRETSLAASRHAPATMPQPEFEEPFEEPAEGVFKPSEGSIGGYGQGSGETASVSSRQSTATTSTSIPVSCGPPYVSYPGPPAASPKYH